MGRRGVPRNAGKFIQSIVVVEQVFFHVVQACVHNIVFKRHACLFQKKLPHVIIVVAESGGNLLDGDALVRNRFYIVEDIGKVNGGAGICVRIVFTQQEINEIFCQDVDDGAVIIFFAEDLRFDF